MSLLTILCTLQAQAALLVMQRHDAQMVSQDLAAIGKWMYAGNMLQLWTHDGTLLAEENALNIRKIVFSDGDDPQALEQTEQGNVIRIYPNPTQDRLMVTGADAETLRIYDLQGRLVKTAAGASIEVNDLSEGTYLLQVGTQVVRFIKQ